MAEGNAKGSSVVLHAFMRAWGVALVEIARALTPPSRRQLMMLAILFLLVTAGGLLALLAAMQAAGSGTTYYVDCDAGDNRRAGTSEATAWQTPWSNRAGGRVLSGGDHLLLKRGCTWGGQEARIMASGGGPGAMIVIESYGDPALAPPTLTNADGTTSCRGDCGAMHWDPGVLMRVMGSFVRIEGLRFVGVPPRREEGCEAQGVGNHSGVWFEGVDGQPAVGNELTRSEVTGMTRGAVIAPTATRTRIHQNRFIANTMMLSLDEAPANDGGAVGIQVQGSDNEIHHNDFRGHDACSYDYGRDGSAVEMWGSGSRNDIHHNVSYDNNSFLEFGKPQGAEPPTGNRIAFNRVVGVDGAAEGQAFVVTRGAQNRFGPILSTTISNNSVYLPGGRARGIVCQSGCGPETLTAINNIIWSDGDGLATPFGTIVCDGACEERHNLLWSSDGSPVVSIGSDRDLGAALHVNSIVADPGWVDTADLDLRLRPDSPAIDAGVVTNDRPPYRTDQLGMPVPAGERVDIGAFEFQP